MTNILINRQDPCTDSEIILSLQANHEPNLSNIQNIRASSQERGINSVAEQNVLRNNLIDTIRNHDTNTQTL